MQTSKGTWTFDRVISTLPTRLTCRLIPALPEDYRSKYDWGQAYGAHCLILALEHQVTDSYWINICDPGYPFTGLFEHTNFRSATEYGGQHLLYLGNYRPMNDPLFAMSKEEVMLLAGVPNEATQDEAQMRAAARQFWPGVKERAKEMWVYPGGWQFYFEGDRLVDLTVAGKPPL